MFLVLEIKVLPKAGVSSIMLDKTGKIVVRVKSDAQEGKANREVIKLFAKGLDTIQANVTIIAGLTVKSKKIKIYTDLTLEQALHKLNIDIQQTL
jgi:uncharacterized protein